MMRAHGAYVDGFHSSHAAIILYLDSGKIAERVGHGVGVEFFQIRSMQCLGRDNSRGGGRRRFLRLWQGSRAVRSD